MAAQYNNSSQNVFFLGVARIQEGRQGGAVVICSHAYNTETDLGAVKQVLEVIPFPFYYFCLMILFV
jgi:hypothetical protein